MNVSDARDKIIVGLNDFVMENEAQSIPLLYIDDSTAHLQKQRLAELLTGLAASAKPAKAIDARMVVRGGATLKLHWEQGKALQALRDGGWDYVVLQEQSTLPITDPATMHQYARLFDAEIKKAGARTVFFLTWARQHQPENQAKLNDAYLRIARELNARVAPVGIAWAKALQGNGGLVLHSEDQSHPNPTGSYLAACVFYSIFYGSSPEALGGRIVGRASSEDGTISEQRSDLVDLSGRDAALLQRLAWQAVQDTRAK